MAATARTKIAIIHCLPGSSAVVMALAFGLALAGAPALAGGFDPIGRVLQGLTGGNPQPSLAERTTRFEILVPSNVEFRVQALRTPSNRVVVEIPTERMVLPDEARVGGKSGLIKSFRGGISAPGKSRVVIEVGEPVVVHKQEIKPAEQGNVYAITIDLVPAAEVTRPVHANPGALGMPPSGLGAAGLQPPLPAPAVRPEQRFAKAWKPLVVIDPGHGGHDSGAKKFGVVEKDVVLAFSLLLKDKLEGTGRYRVLMTRETDVFIGLDARREFAENHNAALFIAVHADYASRTTARGATIYSLRESVADSLRTSARGEVRSGGLSDEELKGVKPTGSDGGTVRRILSDLAAREVDLNHTRTNLFTSTVIDRMGSATELRGQPHRSAAFRVLKTAKVPSVLIELAYVSNQRDAKLLQSQAWREKVSSSIRDSVENYFSRMRHSASVASSRD